MNQESMKQAAATAALSHIGNANIIGIGTGSTVNYFIDALATIKGRFEATVSSSKATTARLKAHGIPVYDLNSVHEIEVYVDGTDEINSQLQCIKGGGGALTGEKIVAAVAQKFICLADASKKVSLLGQFPLAVEVIPMARSYVGREIVKLKGDPVYREGFVTDNGNIILDVYNLEILEPTKLEVQLNSIPGVVENGLFALRPADLLLLADNDGVQIIQR